MAYFGCTQYTLLNELVVLWKQWYNNKAKLLLHIKFQMSFLLITLPLLNWSSVRKFCRLCLLSCSFAVFAIDYMLKHLKQQLRQFNGLWINVFTVLLIITQLTFSPQTHHFEQTCARSSEVLELKAILTVLFSLLYISYWLWSKVKAFKLSS